MLITLYLYYKYVEGKTEEEDDQELRDNFEFVALGFGKLALLCALLGYFMWPVGVYADVTGNTALADLVSNMKFHAFLLASIFFV